MRQPYIESATTLSDYNTIYKNLRESRDEAAKSTDTRGVGIHNPPPTDHIH